jgi:hypothetical protein
LSGSWARRTERLRYSSGLIIAELVVPIKTSMTNRDDGRLFSDSGVIPDSSLSLAELINRREAAHFALNFYPDAREGGGTFVPMRPPRRGVGVKGYALDPQRSAEEAARRARGRIRRYCATHRLNRLGTLTFAGAGCHDQRELRTYVSAFFRQLRLGIGDKPLPYVWVPEWHATDHGLHVHFAVGQYIRRSLIESSWPYGFVHIKLLGDLPVGSGSLGEARKAAGYLSKYVSKSFSDERRIEGLHRYDLAQGFIPKVERIIGTSPRAVIALASERFGSRPVIEWTSADEPNWRGGIAFWAQWN